MIQLGNGILVEAEGCRFRFDPKRVLEGDVCMVSHAHSDHLPTSFKGGSIICSPVTRDFVRLRRKKEFQVSTHPSVRMLDAGHIAGSSMFLVAAGKDHLYTGDFCTRQKAHTKGAKAQKCDVLIIEATYGKPHYIFPDHDEMMGIVRDWLQDITRNGGTAVLYAYPLGKSQELAFHLGELPLVVQSTIAENNRVLRNHGFDLTTDEYDPERTKAPFVYITSGYGKDMARVESMKKKGARTAAFSGWALDREFTSQSRVNEAFPLSDHCDFQELTEFVRECSPEQVFTTHGFAKEFAIHVRRTLGIDAQPLTARQRTLEHFC